MTRNQRPPAYRSARPCVMRTHASMQMQIRILSELCHIRPSNPDEERHLRRHTGAHRCCAKSLIKTALVGFRVRQHARTESISKRAPSTTRTSLRFRINSLRAVSGRLSHTPAAYVCFLTSRLDSASSTRTRVAERAKCVRPLNEPRSLTAICFSWIPGDKARRPDGDRGRSRRARLRRKSSRLT